MMAALKSTVPLLIGLVAGVDAFWRMECPGRVGVARLDPIVSPGKSSAHVHAIHGSSGFSANSNHSSLLNAHCTSCRVLQDKSSYWHPALYFEDAATKQYELVEQIGGMLAYYQLEGNNVTGFPAEFRMIAGNNDRRDYTAGNPSEPDPPKSFWAGMGQTTQHYLTQRAVGFNCLNYNKAPEGTLYRHFMPDKAYLDANCDHGLRSEIMFPSCWKGGDMVDSENHKDHVAYPDLVMTGTCPKEFPVRLPGLMYEVIWNVMKFRNRQGRFVFANGDATGFGYHGDFMMGWDVNFLQAAINTCRNESGKIEDCKLFNLVDEATARKCMMQPANFLSDENVEGPFASLPGNVAVVGGNGAVDDGKGAKPVSAKPVLTYAPGEQPTAPGVLLPGQALKETSSAAPVKEVPAPSLAGLSSSRTSVVAAKSSATSSKQPPPVVAPPPAVATEKPTPSETKSFYSTQYVTNGGLVSKILWEEDFVYVTSYRDTTTTITSSVAAAQPSVGRRAVHRHGHGHRRL